jgi:hypothetical protein
MKRMALALLGLFIVSAIWLAVRPKPSSEYHVGGLYSVIDEKGFRVAKVLAIDADAVHVRIYKNVFDSRPVSLDESKLKLGTINDPNGFGMGHLPLSREAFRSYNPVFIKGSSVQKDELEGYELWKEQGGGVWR